MILKGNQRGGGRQMALHLLNHETNEHVTVHEVRGFMADDVLGALNEAHALSKGTKCRQYMYSLSLSPPEEEHVPVKVFENALERIEKKLGLEDQPRVIVFHEKEGRRHAHAVWSRIDSEEMKAINISHPKRKLNDIARKIFIEQEWRLPEGFRDKSKTSPLNYTRQEWQQALRIGRKADDIKRELQQSWTCSDNKEGFKHALEEQGYYLAQGRRGFVAVDVHGEIYSLTRQLGKKKPELEAQLGSCDDLPTVEDIKTNIHGRLSKLFKGFADDLNLQHEKETQPLKQEKDELVQAHKEQRETLEKRLQERWQIEENQRIARIRRGFKGIWDKVNGRYWRNRKLNEKETLLALKRDEKEQEKLIFEQQEQRQKLQALIKQLREKQDKEKKALFRDLSQVKLQENAPDKNWLKTIEYENQRYSRRRDEELGFDDFDLDEPEI